MASRFCAFRFALFGDFMLIRKKTILTVVISSLLVGFLALPCVAVSVSDSGTGSVTFRWLDVIDTSYNFDSISASTQNSRNTLCNFSNASGSLWFASFDTDTLNLLSGSSYRFNTSVWVSSAVASHNVKICFALIDKPFSVGLPENLNYFYQSSALASGTTQIDCTFTVPADWQTAYLFFQFIPDTSSGSFSGLIQLNQCNISFVNTADTGSWSADSESLSDVDLSNYLDDLETTQGDIFTFLSSGFSSVSGAIQNFARFFSGIWDIFEYYIPEIPWLAIFSLAVGLLCVILNIFSNASLAQGADTRTFKPAKNWKVYSSNGSFRSVRGRGGKK